MSDSREEAVANLQKLLDRLHNMTELEKAALDSFLASPLGQRSARYIERIKDGTISEADAEAHLKAVEKALGI